MDSRTIVVKSLALVDDFTIECKFDYPRSLGKYFVNNTFTATYDRNISSVPESILYIPLLANLAPVAWALGADVRVPELDKNFVTALKDVQRSLQNMYPRVKFSGEVITERLVDSKSSTAPNATAVLFSGGVDSLTSYLLNKDDEIYLVTVWGADVKLHQEEAWALVRHDNENFAKQYNRENLFIKANLRDFLNETTLNSHFGDTIGLWWGNVQHGLGFIGLCAPLSFSQGLKTIYIPSTHTEQFSEPWGSHPTIDNKVRWFNTVAVHHGYSLSRQQKIRVIVDYANKEAMAPQIRACYKSTTGENCSSCEKCSRTMVGLIVEGANPNNYGFLLTSDTLARVQEKFEQGSWHLAENQAFMWNDIKNACLQRKEILSSEYRSFFDWLTASDFEVFVRTSKANKMRRIKWFVHRLPTPAISFIKSIINLKTNTFPST